MACSVSEILFFLAQASTSVPISPLLSFWTPPITNFKKWFLPLLFTPLTLYACLMVLFLQCVLSMALHT